MLQLRVEVFLATLFLIFGVMSNIISTLYPQIPKTESVEAFLRQLLKAQGIFEPKFSEEEVNQFLIQLAEIFEEYIITALAANLNEQQAEQLAHIPENATFQEQISYLSRVVPDIQDKIPNILIEFSKTYLGFNQPQV